LEKGDSTPVHTHTKEEEYLLVLEGTARVLFGDKTIDVPAGTAFTLPRGIQHAWGNASDEPLRATMTAVPGGCEEALVLLTEMGDTLDMAALLEIANKYGVQSVGPPLLGPK
jgi:quercetin dioxygenase-like cupin family protein